MKIQKINIVSESLKTLVGVLKDAEATSEAIKLLGNLDPEFKEDADYLRGLLGIVETQPEIIIPEAPKVEPEPVVEPAVAEENSENSTRRYQVNAQSLAEHFPEAVKFIRKHGSIKVNKYSDTFRAFHAACPNSKCGRNSFYKLIRWIYPPITDDFAVEEFWKQFPHDQRVQLSNLGNIKVFNDGCWEQVKPKRSGQYPVIIVGTQGVDLKSYSLGRAMLETFIPITNNVPRMSVFPVYKDGNRWNCALSNLEWGLNTTTTFPEQFEEACRIIRDNPNASVHTLAKIMDDQKKGVGEYAIRSLLSGKHKEISSKYFSVIDGKVVPVVSQNQRAARAELDKANTEKIVDMIENNKGNIMNLFIMTRDLELAVKLFETKKDLNMYLTELDKMIPVLEFINEGVENTSEILKKIHEKYGYLFITSKRIDEIKSKKFHKEISEIVF